MSPHRIAIKKKIKESIFNSVVKRYLIEQEDMWRAHTRYGESLFDNTTRPSPSPSRSPQLGPRHLELDIDPPKSEDDRTVLPRHHGFNDSELRARAVAALGPTEDPLKRAIDDFYNNNPNETAQQSQSQEDLLDSPLIRPISDTLSKVSNDISDTLSKTSNEIYPTLLIKQAVNSMLPDDMKFDTNSRLLPQLWDEYGNFNPKGVLGQLGLYTVPIVSAIEGRRRRPGSPTINQRVYGPGYNRLANLGSRSLDTVIDPSSLTSRFLKWFGSGFDPARAGHPMDMFRPQRMSDPSYYRGYGDLGKQIVHGGKTSWSRTPQLAKGLAKGAIAPIVGGLAGELLKDQLENAGVFDQYGKGVRERMQQTQDLSPTLGAIRRGGIEAAGRVGAAAENLLWNLDPVNAVYDIAGETEAERHRREKLRDEGQAQSFWDDPLMYSIRAGQEATENSARSRFGLPTGSIEDRVAGDIELWKRDIQAKYPELEKQNEWLRQQRAANRKQDEQEQKEREANRERERLRDKWIPPIPSGLF